MSRALPFRPIYGALFCLGAAIYLSAADPGELGRERGLSRHLADGEESALSSSQLVEWGRRIFCANWTEQDGAGRPTTKGNGHGLSDPTAPLVGARGLNRISGPDANSCMGCHSTPYGTPGGGGDFAAGVFVMGQRFDFVTFDRNDIVPTRGSVDEDQRPASLQDVGNFRKSPGLFGAGYLEMLAREITTDLRSIRDRIRPGKTSVLVSKGISFGRLTKKADGAWDVSDVVGLPVHSVVSMDPAEPPSLIVRPWHQAGVVVSLREFSNNAFNQHHGMQSTERFGKDTDPDGDGIVNELTRADITAVAVFQAAMAVPGRVIPNDPEIERAISVGEFVFKKIGCAGCHIPRLPLHRKGWVYTEPNPFNPPQNLRSGDAAGTVRLNLNDPRLPQPRLFPSKVDSNVIDVPAYTDFKLHDICGADGGGSEPLDQSRGTWSPRFRKGNCLFLTKRLWGGGQSATVFPSRTVYDSEAVCARSSRRGRG